MIFFQDLSTLTQEKEAVHEGLEGTGIVIEQVQMTPTSKYTASCHVKEKKRKSHGTTFSPFKNRKNELHNQIPVAFSISSK